MCKKYGIPPQYFDLSVLSHCNHSIIDYGTFGFWSAYLAGGITLVANEGKHMDLLLAKRAVKEAKIENWFKIDRTEVERL